jgi:3-oxoacyl-[acyl-carrier protein] reductase
MGRATILALAEEGADVAIHDLPSEEAEGRELVEQVRGMGRRSILTLGDVSRRPGCERIVRETIEAFGQLDILVNNAGGGEFVDFFDITEEHFDYILALNLKSAFFVAQAAARHMVTRDWGRIINISSEVSYVGEPEGIPYSSAKGGMRTMTKALALALAPTITVNTVAPGPTDTQMIEGTYDASDEYVRTIPLKRLVRPQDVARSVVFLASPDGDAYTGQTLDPNGGVVMN